MKFLRQFAATLLVVAAVVALGVAWAHSTEADWIFSPPPGVGGPGFAKVISGHGPPPGGHRAIVLRPGQHLPAGFHPGQVRIEAAGHGAPFDPADSGNLIRTAEIEAAVIAGVVVLDVLRRRHRRAKRAARLAAKT